jgi:hypothetical protein
VDVENIVFCITQSSPSSPSSPSTDRVANKRRKFGPRAAPREFDVDEPAAHAGASFAGRNMISVS